MSERIAILPGSFDPPTRGHVALLESALQQNDIDHVVVVPVHNPTKKGRLLPAETAMMLLKKMLPPDIAACITLCDGTQKPTKLATKFNAAAIIRGKRAIDPPRKTFMHEAAVAAYFTAYRLVHLKKPLHIKWLTSPTQRISSSRLRHTLFKEACTQKKLERFVPAEIAALLMKAKARCPHVSKENNAEFNKALASLLAAPPTASRRTHRPGL